MENLWKKSVRKRMFDKRNEMNLSQVQELSRKIVNTLTKVPIFKQSNNIMLYLSFNNEVDSYELIEYCLGNKKCVIVPYCNKEGKQIIPAKIENFEKQLVKNDYGFLESKLEYIKPEPIDSIDLIIIPGLAFDKRCYRIGYGTGYYDRFLGKVNSKIPTIGLVFDYQIIDSAEVDEFDIPLDYVITERRIIVR